MPLQFISTTQASVERTEDGLVLVRIKPGGELSQASIGEFLGAQKRLAADPTYGLVIIIPDDINWDAKIMYMDHFTAGEEEFRPASVAIVSEGTLFERLAGLYFAHHRTAFPVSIFRQLPEAVAWIKDTASKEGEGQVGSGWASKVRALVQLVISPKTVKAVALGVCSASESLPVLII
jgi:hypothetical protein